MGQNESNRTDRRAVGSGPALVLLEVIFREVEHRILFVFPALARSLARYDLLLSLRLPLDGFDVHLTW